MDTCSSTIFNMLTKHATVCSAKRCVLLAVENSAVHQHCATTDTPIPTQTHTGRHEHRFRQEHLELDTANLLVDTQQKVSLQSELNTGEKKWPKMTNRKSHHCFLQHEGQPNAEVQSCFVSQGKIWPPGFGVVSRKT